MLTTVASEIVFRIEIDGHGNSRGRTTGHQQRFREFYSALGLRLPALRGEIPVEIDKAAETRGRIEKAGGGKIQARDVELGVERS